MRSDGRRLLITLRDVGITSRAGRRWSRWTLVLWGCGLALYPYLDPPDLTVHNAAASRRTLSLLLAALAAGAVILFPSLGYLFRVFKAHTFATAWRP